MTRRGVVLGAGGVLGAAYMIGALRAYAEATGVEPRDADALIGTSAGSILAAFLGCGIATEQLMNHQRGIVVEGDPRIEYDADRDSGGALPPRPKLRIGSTSLLRATARNPRRVTPLAALSAIAPQGRGSLAPVRSMIEAVQPTGWAPHPSTWVVAMDYDTGKRIPFGREGAPDAALAQAVTASCAIPGWYEPVRIGSRRYVDGGACSPTSLDLLAPLELDEVLVVSPMTSFELDEPSSLAGRLERQLRRRVTKRLVREASKVRASGATVTIVTPGRRDLEAMGPNLMDPRRRERVLETAWETTTELLRSGRPDTAQVG